MTLQSRVTILVKASPQPSKSHQETVCCAGIQADGNWKRLFPIRFRRLEGSKAFRRWDIVDYAYRIPADDYRKESCRVHEESIRITGRVTHADEKSRLIDRALVSSENEAISRGDSLAVVRPHDVALSWTKLTADEIDSDRKKFQEQAKQLSMLEKENSAYEPCPYRFTLHYRDAGGPHKKTCADWETSAAFFRLRSTMGEQDILKHLEATYCEKYVQAGLVIALGNMKKRPKTWQLLGLFPVLPTRQDDLFG